MNYIGKGPSFYVQLRCLLQLWPNTGLVSEGKNGGGPRLLGWSMLLFRMFESCIVLKVKSHANYITTNI